MKRSIRFISIFIIINFIFNLLSLGIINSYAEDYSGFKLVSKKYIEDIKSNAVEFYHQKSGAKLLFLQNDDDNKVFSIAFRTLPKDNTGVNHILEHSVLCGSKNYPVKEPFLIMKKQSMSTFLNAMTSSDFTMYPVASRNDKDFQNLMGVYLDAVFYPKIYEESRILDQEGWHYELDSKDSNLKYNGIVYNEMRGNYSSPNNILFNEINKSLFPDTVYKFDSGGNPDYIPNLTYNKFINTHKNYYVPSNSVIYLYGNLDIKKTLKFIDEKYLNNFNKTDIDTSIPTQKSFDKRIVKISEYGVENNTKINDMTYLSLNYVIGKAQNQETNIAMAILSELLLGRSSSPLKKAFIDNKLGVNSYGMYNDSSIQPTFSIIAENTNEDDKEKFEKIIKEALENVIKEGFDKRLIKSVLNTSELSMLSFENNEQKGLNYSFDVIKAWVYNQELTKYLQKNAIVKKIKSNTDNRYFENLVENYLLKNSHSSIVILKPKVGLEEETSLNINNKLCDYKSKLSNDEIEHLVNKTKELKDWQQKPDSKENIEKVPALNIEDLNKKAEKIYTAEDKEGNTKILSHIYPTNGISYVNFYFDSSKVPQSNLLYLKLLSYVLGDMDTNKHNYMELANEISTYTGGVSFYPTAFEKYNTLEYNPKMVVKTSYTQENINKTFKLLDEIMNNTTLKNKEHLKDIIKQIRYNVENNISEEGMNIALDRTKSYISDSGRYNDLKNIPFYNFILDIDKNFDEKYNDIANHLDDVRMLVFNKENLIVSYTGDKENYDKFKQEFSKFIYKIKDEKFKTQVYKFQDAYKNEGLIIPSKVQYVTRGGTLENENYKYSGKLKVLEHILNNDYLWKKVRVKGGAYGGYVSISNKDIIFYSYRDPNLKETLNTFEGAVDYLKNFNTDKREMTNFIIGTIAAMDYPTSPMQKGDKGDYMYIAGINQADIQKMRKEALSTTAQDIRNYGKLLENVLKQNYYCVVGGEEKIKKDKEIFDNIKDIINN